MINRTYSSSSNMLWRQFKLNSHANHPVTDREILDAIRQDKIALTGHVDFRKWTTLALYALLLFALHGG